MTNLLSHFGMALSSSLAGPTKQAKVKKPFTASTWFEIPIGSDGLNIQQHHYETLQNSIDRVLARYLTVMDEYREQNLSQTSICQKLLYGAGIEQWITDTLGYLSAEDLMKALERICPCVESNDD